MMSSIPVPSSSSLSPHSHPHPRPSNHATTCYSPMQSPRTSLSPSPQKPVAVAATNFDQNPPSFPSQSRRPHQETDREQRSVYHQHQHQQRQRHPLKDTLLTGNQPQSQLPRHTSTDQRRNRTSAPPHPATMHSSASTKSAAHTLSTKSTGKTSSDSRSASGISTRQKTNNVPQVRKGVPPSLSSTSESGAWTRRRRQKTDHSSADEEEEAPPLESPTSENGGEVAGGTLSAAQESTCQQESRPTELPVSSVPQKRTSQAGSNGSSAYTASSQGLRHSQPSLIPAPAVPHHDLEDHFAQVSMTPPTNHVKPTSAFGAGTVSKLDPQASMDCPRRTAPHHAVLSRLTRTSAFGPLSPLQDRGEEYEVRSDDVDGGLGGGLKRTVRLHGDLAAPPRAMRKFGHIAEGDSESSEASADERSVGNQSPSVHAAKQRLGHRPARSRTIESSTQEVSSVAQRRGRTPTFLMPRRGGDSDIVTKPGDLPMDLDSDIEIGAPPSPSPMGSSDGSLTSVLRADLTASIGQTRGLLQPGPLGWATALHRRGSAGSMEEPYADSNTLGYRRLATSASAGESLPARDLSPPSTHIRPSRHTSSHSTSSTSSASAHNILSSSSKPAKPGNVSSSSPHKVKRRLTTADKGTRPRASPSQEEKMGTETHSAKERFRFPTDPDSSASMERTSNHTRRRSSTANRSNQMEKMIAARALGPFEVAETPSKGVDSHHDDSGLGLSFTSCDEHANTPFKRGDRFLPAGFDDTPEKGLLDGTMGGTGSLIFQSIPARTRKSTSCDSIVSTPARPKPASINHRGPFNPFGPIQRSSLAKEASFTPGGSDSGPSSPDCGASQRTISVPEGLSSIESSVPYLTPQNFKNVKPLQTAFMSTGLVSKRTRGVTTADGEVLSLPPRPNFSGNVTVAAAPAATSTMPAGGMAAAMGLKDVVAATVRRASAGGIIVGSAGQQGPSAMPDTPMKKMPGGLAPQVLAGAIGNGHNGPHPRQPPPSVLRPTAFGRNIFGNFAIAGASSLSTSSSLTVPSLSPGRDSVSSADGGESPIFGDTCDSPTMTLVSVCGSGSDLKNTQEWPQFNALPQREEGSAQSMLPSADMSISPSTKDVPMSLPIGMKSTIPHLSVTRSPVAAPLPMSSRQPMRRTRTNAGVLAHAVPPIVTQSRGKEGNPLSDRLEPRPPAARSFSEQVGIPRPRSRLGERQGSEASEGEGPTSAGPLSARLSLFRHRSRPGFGLQRKASFGVGSDGTLAANSPTVGLCPIPSTPTRAGGPIKWYEAARLGTTPSPPSRRQGKDSLRFSLAGGKSKGRNLELPKTAVIPATPRGPSSAHDEIGRFQSRFTQLAVLGSGEFSEAVKVEDKVTGDVSAVKRMKRRFVGPRDRLRHLEEVDILRHLGSHLNVISLIAAWEEDAHLFIQTELCPLGTLSFFLEGYGYLVGTLDEPRLWKVLAELSSGLQHIHSHGVLHLDLKPANVFITEIGTLKIGDFGLASRWPTVEPAVILSGAQIGPTDPVDAGLPPPNSLVNSLDPNANRKQRRGSKGCNLEREGDREYLAPEIIQEGRYSKAADIFSLGLIMVEAVGNVVMPDNGEPWQKLRNDDLSDVDFSQTSVSLFRLIQSMLASAPHKRPSVEEILGHPVVAAVQEKMRGGLRASELDQLPDFDLPRTRSGLSTIHSSSSLGGGMSSSSSGGDKMRSEDEDVDLVDELADRSSSSIAAQVAPDTPALSIRGALIQEDDAFLSSVLSFDPDPEARELAVMEWDSSGEMMGDWRGEDDAVLTGAGVGDESAILGQHFADETFPEEEEEAHSQEQQRVGVQGRRDEEDFSMDVDEEAFS